MKYHTPREGHRVVLSDCRRANLKVDKENAKNKLLQKDQNLAALQERLEQKKAERLGLQQKSRVKRNNRAPTMVQEKVRWCVVHLSCSWDMFLPISSQHEYSRT